MARVAAMPFFVLLMGVGALAMMVPALHALALGDYRTSRIFLYGAILSGMLTVLIGLATRSHVPRSVARSQLMSLAAAFGLLPVMLAAPFFEAAQLRNYLHAWFEMVSSFTTTGATLYDSVWRLNPSLHLWRALVGWLGGFLIWVTAISILAPMNLGGFEVRSSAAAGAGVRSLGQTARIADPTERLARYSLKLAPIYCGLTFLLWIGLILAGDSAFVAICHAMSTLSTSGISPLSGMHAAPSGFAGEAIIFVFLFFALSRLTFSRGLASDERNRIWRDPEFGLALVILATVPTLLFLRHFLAAAENDVVSGLADAIRAFWGGLFTVLSFLTTTGFESREWMGMSDFSRLETPGLILVGLALIGGGVATTAGGVKLLRVYALARHGQRELERLVHPDSVGGSGAEARRIRRQGAYVAWIFFMLYALSIVAVMLLLSLTGVQFENAMVLAVAALSTTGPLAQVAAESPVLYSGIPDAAKAILALTMVLGRLELLAIIALLNPEFWRD